MIMPSCLSTVRRLLPLTVMILGVGCAMHHHAEPNSDSPIVDADAGLDEIRELRLFGQSSSVDDIAFEGKAAVSIQQHTSTSEGSDFDPAIDPTGKLLVFGSTRHSKFSHLYTKAIEGSTLTQITDGSANDAQPCFSPDGQRIAFASDRAGQWDIWIVDANGRGAMQVTNSPLAELHPTWSPDGKHLAYCRINPKHSAGELWIADLNNPSSKRFLGEGLFPSWSPKGDRIAFQKARQRGSRWYSVWTITLENNEPSPPTEILSGPDLAFIAPSWSADGAQLAVACVSSSPDEGLGSPLPRSTTAARADIAIVDADGRGIIRLTSGHGENYSPVWSNDDRIYFSVKLADSETIWSIKPFRPSLSPDGNPAAQHDRQSALTPQNDLEP